MAENENIVVNEMPPETQPQPEQSKLKVFFANVWAGIKEWARKQVVALKRTPQRIPIFLTFVTTALWLFCLFPFSRSAYSLSGINVLGLIVFVVTLLAILIIPSVLNAFPKRKKPSILFIVLFFAFTAGMIALDIVYYVMCYDFLYIQGAQPESWISSRPYISQSFVYAIVHIVLLAISALSLALLPVYTPLIRKINTAKSIEGNDLHEHIDIEDEE